MPTMQPVQVETKRRRKYTKPEIEKVRLVPEEAVLTPCKAIDGVFNTWLGSSHCGYWLQCQAVGS